MSSVVWMLCPATVNHSRAPLMVVPKSPVATRRATAIERRGVLVRAEAFVAARGPGSDAHKDDAERDPVRLALRGFGRKPHDEGQANGREQQRNGERLAGCARREHSKGEMAADRG